MVNQDRVLVIPMVENMSGHYLWRWGRHKFVVFVGWSKSCAEL